MKDLIISSLRSFRNTLEQNANIVDPDGKGEKYFFLPFWFEKFGVDSYRLHSLGNLPAELLEHLNKERTGFAAPGEGKNTKDMKKLRFKTKQEWGPRDGVLPWGEPYNKEAHSGTYPQKIMLTDKAHPYASQNIKILVSSALSMSGVESKARSLGYALGLRGPAPRNYPFEFYLYSDMSAIWTGKNPGDDFSSHYATELTPNQFLEGYLPDEAFDHEKINKRIDDLLGKAEKPDAFILEVEDGRIFIRTVEEERVEISPGEVYKYNILHANEFFEKHPGPLKFKQWDVKSDMNYIKVGCIGMSREYVEGFVKIIDALDQHNVSSAELYKFLHSHKEELDLNF